MTCSLLHELVFVDSCVNADLDTFDHDLADLSQPFTIYM